MQAVNLNSRSIRLFPFVLTLFAMVAVSSCAKKIRFPTSTVVPAAQGSVKVKKDKNNNYTLDVSINNLAEPDRLTPPKQTYVVWIESESNGTKNVGQMKSSTGFLSSKLKASLEAVTAFKPTRVFITAEDDGNAQFPTGQVVLRTESF